MKFREFLLNEDSKYLSEKIGGILSILHATQEDKDGLGSRDIETYAQKVINQIKPILNISKGSKDVQRSLQESRSSNINCNGRKKRRRTLGHYVKIFPNYRKIVI